MDEDSPTNPVPWCGVDQNQGQGSLYRTGLRSPLNKEKGLSDSGKSQDQDIWRENAQHSKVQQTASSQDNSIQASSWNIKAKRTTKPSSSLHQTGTCSSVSVPPSPKWLCGRTASIIHLLRKIWLNTGQKEPVEHRADKATRPATWLPKD